MNYKVMQRPMFKMGGKAASQGTGITSGLDEKVNMSGGRANYATGPELRNEFLTSALDKYRQRQEKQQGLENLVDLQALAKVSNVLSTEGSNNPFDIIKNIAMSGSEIALPALSAKRASARGAPPRAEGAEGGGRGGGRHVGQAGAISRAVEVQIR